MNSMKKMLFCIVGCLVGLVGCQKDKTRHAVFTYSYSDSTTLDRVDTLYAGHSYILRINYVVDDTNSKKFSFDANVLMNDNIVVDFSDGSTTNIVFDGNTLITRMSGEGKGAIELFASYRINAMSSGISNFNLSNLQNISFETTSFQIEVNNNA